MKKEAKKYRIICSTSKKNIKSHFFNRWFGKLLRKYWYVWSLELLAILVPPFWLDVINVAIPKIFGYFLVILVAGNYIAFLASYHVIGKRYFNKVKDLPEPIDLDEVE